MRAVEREGAGLDFRQAGTALDAGEVLAVGALAGIVAVGDIGDDEDAFAEAQGRFNGIAEAREVRAGGLRGIYFLNDIWTACVQRGGR